MPKTTKEACADVERFLSPRWTGNYDQLHYVTLFMNQATGEGSISTNIQETNQILNVLRQMIRHVESEQLIVPASVIIPAAH